MLTAKQRAYLRSKAMAIDPTLQIGKDGITENVLMTLCQQLEARELVKITLLSNCIENAKDIASFLAEKSFSEIVSVVGRKIVLFKQNKKSKFDLSKL